MKSPTKARLVGWGLAAAAGVGAAAWRIGQATAGSVPGLQVVTELAVIGSALGVVLVTALLWGATTGFTRALFGSVLALWAAAALVPMWRLGHQSPAHFEGRLAGADREATTAPVSEHTVFRLTLETDRPTDSEYRLHIRVGDNKRIIRGSFATPWHGPLTMAAGQRATLFLERGSATSIRIALPPRSWLWIRIGAVIALLLAALVEIPLTRSRPRLRGLWTAIAALPAIFVIALDPASQPSGPAAAAAAILAVFASGILGGLWGIAAGRVHRRKDPARSRR